MGTEHIDSSWDIQSLPYYERPDVRMELLGADGVSTVELLSIVTCSGGVDQDGIERAYNLLATFGGI